jgi:hypothetical protein
VTGRSRARRSLEVFEGSLVETQDAREVQEICEPRGSLEVVAVDVEEEDEEEEEEEDEEPEDEEPEDEDELEELAES